MQHGEQKDKNAQSRVCGRVEQEGTCGLHAANFGACRQAEQEEIGACGLRRQNFELHGGRFGASRVGWRELRSAREPGAHGRGEATVGCGSGHASGAPNLE
ncbi:hypothetical protein E2562_025200 [Oryza meyeriana var. granulata]|uniref:Uncharacterized protein n=1 Tax=Oryza meyeriana var. granulata TaxID=110450 RepID=A0A6G1E2A6_9ORYZ|nr:hypothetical protein E2562_025200 [Oryza meyeriana var. granulata]